MTTTPDKQGDKKTKPEIAREKRFALYSAIPKGDWMLLTENLKPPKGLARGTLDEHARASGLPIVDLENGKIDLAEVVCWIHTTIREKKHLFTEENSKGNPLDRKREAEANIAEIRERELKNELIPRDQLHDIFGRLSRLMRTYAEGLEKRNETEALAAYNKMLQSFKRELQELKTEE